MPQFEPIWMLVRIFLELISEQNIVVCFVTRDMGSVNLFGIANRDTIY